MRFFRWLKKKLFPKKQTGNTNKPDNSTGRVSDSELRWFYPSAQWLPDLSLLKTRWSLDFTEPKKLIILVHHTAGHQNQKAKDFIKFFLKRGLCTDFLDHKGQVWQQRHGDRVGYNAGESKFKGRSNTSKFAIAIEIAGGGKLKLRQPGGSIISWNMKYIPEGAQLVTYFGKPIHNARYVTKADGYEETGWYEPFTKHQEKELVNYFKHWVSLGVPKENIVGHDEVAGKKYLGRQRKNDPGGSLSLPLDKFVEKHLADY